MPFPFRRFLAIASHALANSLLPCARPPSLRSNLSALRSLAKNWMPLLLNAFLTTPPEQRAQLEQSISAYACIADPATLATFFRAAITKLIKVPPHRLHV